MPLGFNHGALCSCFVQKRPLCSLARTCAGRGWPELSNFQLLQHGASRLACLLPSPTQAYDDAASRGLLSPLVQPMLAVLGQLLSSGDETEAHTVLELFIVVGVREACGRGGGWQGCVLEG